MIRITVACLSSRSFCLFRSVFISICFASDFKTDGQSLRSFWSVWDPFFFNFIYFYLILLLFLAVHLVWLNFDEDEMLVQNLNIFVVVVVVIYSVLLTGVYELVFCMSFVYSFVFFFASIICI